VKPTASTTSERVLRLRLAGALAAWGGLLTVAAWFTPPAGAEVTATAQAQTANAAFLARAVPPGPAAGVCLVDSGVDVNPDTSHVVARLALDGDDATDGSPTKHGTSMAMVMGAGLNGFGAVGLFPAVRVVSVRATVAGVETITPIGAVNAINRCNDESVGHALRVIELALTLTESLPADQSAELAAAIAAARANGFSVVAAAGNRAGGRVESPASQPGVLSVGGSAADGQRCTGSAGGAVLQAPGCGLDEVDPVTGNPVAATAGTSQASALVAAALAALLSWRPELTAVEAEQALIQSARATPSGQVMDVAGALRRLGLGAVVDAYQPAGLFSTAFEAPSLAAPSSPLRHSSKRARLPRPLVRVRAMRRYRGVLVSARNRPRGTTMVVLATRADAAGRLRRVARRARHSDRVALRVRGWDELRVRFRDRAGARAIGPVTIIVHPRRRSLS
jgi:hypothetical protein